MDPSTGNAFDSLRLEAKRLLKDLRRGDEVATRRFTQYWPSTGPTGEVRNLARAQLVIAREHGYRSWAQLKTSLLSRKEQIMDTEFYPEFADKAAVLVVHIARNHPLPDGNKRLAWQSLTIFCALNGRRLEVSPDEAVTTMLAIAAGEPDEVAVAAWLTDQLGSNPS